MANTTEELIKIILSIDGKEGLKALEQQIKLNTGAIDDLKQGFAAGSVTFEDFMSKSKKLAGAQAELTGLFDQMQKGASLSGNKLLQLGNTVDDLQYVGEMGLRPIINNVMQIAPAVGIALIAVEMLRKKFGEDLLEAIGWSNKEMETAATKVENLKKKIEELEKRPGKVVLDYTALEEARKELEKIESIKNTLEATKTSAREKTMTGIGSAIVTDYGGGSGNLAGIVEGVDRATGVNRATPAQAAQMAQLKYQLEHQPRDSRTGMPIGDPETYKKAIGDQIAGLQMQISEEYRKYAEEEVAKFAQGDPGAIASMKNRVNQAPGMFNQQGMDGLTLADAVGMMPGSAAEHAAQQRQTERHARNNKESIDGIVESNTANAYIQGLWDTIAGQDKAKKAQGEEEAERLKEAENKKKAAALKKSKEDLAKTQTRSVADAAKDAAALAELNKADALDPASVARRNLMPKARAHLANAGFNKAGAEAYAPQLTDALLKGVSLDIATQTLVANALRALATAQDRQRTAEQMLRQNQELFRRTRMHGQTHLPTPGTR